MSTLQRTIAIQEKLGNRASSGLGCSTSGRVSRWQFSRRRTVHQRPGLKSNRHRQRWCLAAVTYPRDGDDSEDDQLSSLDQQREQLSRLMGAGRVTGSDLRQLSIDKWGRSYDMRLCKRGTRVYFQVMWKFLEQQSFPLSESDYVRQLDAVAEYVTAWGASGTVRAGIQAASSRGPGFTGGGGARAISIPLDVDMAGARSGEWDGCI